jgi:peptidoglycan DL-endopeptidase CwlO
VPSGRRRQAQAFVVGVAALFAVASAGAQGVAEKEAQAQSVLAQIQQIDRSLGAAVESYNLANVKLDKIEADLRENRQQLRVTRENLKLAQNSLAARLVTAYTSGTDDSALAVLLGAASFEDLLDRMETINASSQQDASIVEQVTSFKAAVQRNRVQLRNAHAEQRRIVAEKAAQRERIESQLASRRQLLSSIRGEIARMRAAERAQQRVLAAAAQARLDSGNLAAAAPEGALAPPNTHGGVVGIAMQYLGVPYRWGGSSPSGFDCSGFVMYVFAQIGISLPHSTYALWNVGVPVSRSQLQAGDLVFFNGLGHMGIYIGGNQFIHAPHTGDVVKISSMTGWYASTYYGARRV